MIALTVVTHPKTNAFLQNFLSSLSGELPPVYIVGGDFEQFTSHQEADISRFCNGTGGMFYPWPTATWEAGAIHVMNKFAPAAIKEFVFLQDTFEFKEGMFDHFWERIEMSKGETLWFTANHQMYAGKFRREVLDKITPWRWPTSKGAAVAMEGSWRDTYNKAEYPHLSRQWGHMPDGTEEVEKCGRLNVRCENEYYIKWKGTHCGNLQDRLREIDDEGKL